jgi:endonuclease/exonuclease/phosphatase family metal-dependent hydrolase
MSPTFMRIAIFTLAAALASIAPAVEIRVATFNIGAHWNDEFFDYSLGDPGSPDHDSVKAILQRINADVVALQEIHSVDLQGNPDDLDNLAAALGYPYLHVPPTSGAFDSTLRVVIFSRFPFISSGQIGSAPNANEITRLHPVVKVNVPGTTNDPLIVSAHLKAGTTTEDRFRRAIEMKRLAGYLTNASPGADDNFIILGDFNPSSSNTSVTLDTYSAFFTKPNRVIPLSYVVGSDVVFPVVYSTNMLSYFSSPAVVKLDPRQLNGSRSTFNTSSAGGPTLDLMMVSPSIAGRPYGTEIYNSALDVSNAAGLPKAGGPLADQTSAVASDHYAVFADLELDSDFPNLDLALSNASVREGSASGQVTATVTLPAVRSTAVTVMISSDEPSAADPVTETLIIPAGALTGRVDISTPRNFIEDSQRPVTLSASASGYDPDVAVLWVEDADGPYVFTSVGQSIMEDFNGFSGNHDPSPWLWSGPSTWLGLDDGSSSVPGRRAYGTSAETAMGCLPQDAPETAAAVFTNHSDKPLTALRISMEARQWRAENGGAGDSIAAEIRFDGAVFPLRALDFAASRTLPSGPAAAAAVDLTAVATGLWIPPGSSFELRIIFSPGAESAAASADVFINEFHYDNSGTDVGEFVELVAGPGFAGSLQDIDLVLYNGGTESNGLVYGTLNLATAFDPGAVIGGYRLFVANFPANGLQNGPRDGFAVYNRATSQVLHFISYQGTMTAGSGPAAGMTSVDTGVSQSNPGEAGVGAIGLSGSGGSSADFDWTKFTGIAHSPGILNQGQTLAVPVLPHQGMGVDNLSVVFLPDNDLDGIPDHLDEDDDNDGQSDSDEVAFGTDPFDPASVFSPDLSEVPAGLALAFPGATGFQYTVQWSADLDKWHDLSTHGGSGQLIVVPLPMTGPEMFFRVRSGD